jgi:hypothetical protein
MTEHTEQTAAPSEAAPARIQLDDFIEAVTRGVTRALAAEDEVSGYAAKIGGVRPPITVLAGFFPYPPTNPYPFGDLSGGQGTMVEQGLR